MKGFTLIEILLTVAVLAIMVTSIFIGVSTFSKKRILEHYERRVVSALEEARISAITKRMNSDWGVKFLSDKAVLFRGPTYASAAPGSEVIYILGPVSATTTAPNQEIVFKKGTAVASSSGTISFTYGTYAATIEVLVSGVIQSDVGAI